VHNKRRRDYTAPAPFDCQKQAAVFAGSCSRAAKPAFSARKVKDYREHMQHKFPLSASSTERNEQTKPLNTKNGEKEHLLSFPPFSFFRIHLLRPAELVPHLHYLISLCSYKHIPAHEKS